MEQRLTNQPSFVAVRDVYSVRYLVHALKKYSSDSEGRSSSDPLVSSHCLQNLTSLVEQCSHHNSKGRFNMLLAIEEGLVDALNLLPLFNHQAWNSAVPLFVRLCYNMSVILLDLKSRKKEICDTVRPFQILAIKLLEIIPIFKVYQSFYQLNPDKFFILQHLELFLTCLNKLNFRQSKALEEACLLIVSTLAMQFYSSFLEHTSLQPRLILTWTEQFLEFLHKYPVSTVQNKKLLAKTVHSIIQGTRYIQLNQLSQRSLKNLVDIKNIFSGQHISFEIQRVLAQVFDVDTMEKKIDQLRKDVECGVRHSDDMKALDSLLLMSHVSPLDELMVQRGCITLAIKKIRMSLSRFPEAIALKTVKKGYRLLVQCSKQESFLPVISMKNDLIQLVKEILIACLKINIINLKETGSYESFARDIEGILACTVQFMRFLLKVDSKLFAFLLSGDSQSSQGLLQVALRLSFPLSNVSDVTATFIQFLNESLPVAVLQDLPSETRWSLVECLCECLHSFSSVPKTSASLGECFQLCCRFASVACVKEKRLLLTHSVKCLRQRYQHSYIVSQALDLLLLCCCATNDLDDIMVSLVEDTTELNAFCDTLMNAVVYQWRLHSVREKVGHLMQRLPFVGVCVPHWISWLQTAHIISSKWALAITGCHVALAFQVCDTRTITPLEYSNLMSALHVLCQNAQEFLPDISNENNIPVFVLLKETLGVLEFFFVEQSQYLPDILNEIPFLLNCCLPLHYTVKSSVLQSMVDFCIKVLKLSTARSVKQVYFHTQLLMAFSQFLTTVLQCREEKYRGILFPCWAHYLQNYIFHPSNSEMFSTCFMMVLDILFVKSNEGFQCSSKTLVGTLQLLRRCLPKNSTVEKCIVEKLIELSVFANFIKDVPVYSELISLRCLLLFYQQHFDAFLTTLAELVEYNIIKPISYILEDLSHSISDVLIADPIQMKILLHYLFTCFFQQLKNQEDPIELAISLTTFFFTLFNIYGAKIFTVCEPVAEYQSFAIYLMEHWLSRNGSSSFLNLSCLIRFLKVICCNATHSSPREELFSAVFLKTLIRVNIYILTEYCETDAQELNEIIIFIFKSRKQLHQHLSIFISFLKACLRQLNKATTLVEHHLVILEHFTLMLDMESNSHSRDLLLVVSQINLIENLHSILQRINKGVLEETVWITPIREGCLKLLAQLSEWCNRSSCCLTGQSEMLAIQHKHVNDARLLTAPLDINMQIPVIMLSRSGDLTERHIYVELLSHENVILKEKKKQSALFLEPSKALVKFRSCGSSVPRISLPKHCKKLFTKKHVERYSDLNVSICEKRRLDCDTILSSSFSGIPFNTSFVEGFSRKLRFPESSYAFLSSRKYHLVNPLSMSLNDNLGALYDSRSESSTQQCGGRPPHVLIESDISSTYTFENKKCSRRPQVVHPFAYMFQTIRAQKDIVVQTCALLPGKFSFVSLRIEDLLRTYYETMAIRETSEGSRVYHEALSKFIFKRLCAVSETYPTSHSFNQLSNDVIRREKDYRILPHSLLGTIPSSFRFDSNQSQYVSRRNDEVLQFHFITTTFPQSFQMTPIMDISKFQRFQRMNISATVTAEAKFSNENVVSFRTYLSQVNVEASVEEKHVILLANTCKWPSFQRMNFLIKAAEPHISCDSRTFCEKYSAPIPEDVCARKVPMISAINVFKKTPVQEINCLVQERAAATDAQYTEGSVYRQQYSNLVRVNSSVKHTERTFFKDASIHCSIQQIDLLQATLAEKGAKNCKTQMYYRNRSQRVGIATSVKNTKLASIIDISNLDSLQPVNVFTRVISEAEQLGEIRFNCGENLVLVGLNTHVLDFQEVYSTNRSMLHLAQQVREFLNESFVMRVNQFNGDWAFRSLRLMKPSDVNGCIWKESEDTKSHVGAYCGGKQRYLLYNQSDSIYSTVARNLGCQTEGISGLLNASYVKHFNLYSEFGIVLHICGSIVTPKLVQYKNVPRITTQSVNLLEPDNDGSLSFIVHLCSQDIEFGENKASRYSLYCAMNISKRFLYANQYKKMRHLLPRYLYAVLSRSVMTPHKNLISLENYEMSYCSLKIILRYLSQNPCGKGTELSPWNGLWKKHLRVNNYLSYGGILTGKGRKICNQLSLSASCESHSVKPWERKLQKNTQKLYMLWQPRAYDLKLRDIAEFWDSTRHLEILNVEAVAPLFPKVFSMIQRIFQSKSTICLTENELYTERVAGCYCLRLLHHDPFWFTKCCEQQELGVLINMLFYAVHEIKECHQPIMHTLLDALVFGCNPARWILLYFQDGSRHTHDIRFEDTLMFSFIVTIHATNSRGGSMKLLLLHLYCITHFFQQIHQSQQDTSFSCLNYTTIIHLIESLLLAWDAKQLKSVNVLCDLLKTLRTVWSTRHETTSSYNILIPRLFSLLHRGKPPLTSLHHVDWGSLQAHSSIDWATLKDVLYLIQVILAGRVLSFKTLRILMSTLLEILSISSRIDIFLDDIQSLEQENIKKDDYSLNYILRYQRQSPHVAVSKASCQINCCLLLARLVLLYPPALEMFEIHEGITTVLRLLEKLSFQLSKTCHSVFMKLLLLNDAKTGMTLICNSTYRSSHMQRGYGRTNIFFLLAKFLKRYRLEAKSDQTSLISPVADALVVLFKVLGNLVLLPENLKYFFKSEISNVCFEFLHDMVSLVQSKQLPKNTLVYLSFLESLRNFTMHFTYETAHHFLPFFPDLLHLMETEHTQCKQLAVGILASLCRSSRNAEEFTLLKGHTVLMQELQRICHHTNHELVALLLKLIERQGCHHRVALQLLVDLGFLKVIKEYFRNPLTSKILVLRSLRILLVAVCKLPQKSNLLPHILQMRLPSCALSYSCSLIKSETSSTTALRIVTLVCAFLIQVSAETNGCMNCKYRILPSPGFWRLTHQLTTHEIVEFGNNLIHLINGLFQGCPRGGSSTVPSGNDLVCYEKIDRRNFLLDLPDGPFCITSDTFLLCLAILISFCQEADAEVLVKTFSDTGFPFLLFSLISRVCKHQFSLSESFDVCYLVFYSLCLLRKELPRSAWVQLVQTNICKQIMEDIKNFFYSLEIKSGFTAPALFHNVSQTLIEHTKPANVLAQASFQLQFLQFISCQIYETLSSEMPCSLSRDKTLICFKPSFKDIFLIRNIFSSFCQTVAELPVSVVKRIRAGFFVSYLVSLSSITYESQKEWMQTTSQKKSSPPAKTSWTLKSTLCSASSDFSNLELRCRKSGDILISRSIAQVVYIQREFRGSSFTSCFSSTSRLLLNVSPLRCCCLVLRGSNKSMTQDEIPLVFKSLDQCNVFLSLFLEWRNAALSDMN